MLFPVTLTHIKVYLCPLVPSVTAEAELMNYICCWELRAVLLDNHRECPQSISIHKHCADTVFSSVNFIFTNLFLSYIIGNNSCGVNSSEKVLYILDKPVWISIKHCENGWSFVFIMRYEIPWILKFSHSMQQSMIFSQCLRFECSCSFSIKI